MYLYLLRKFLFLFEPERAHNLTLRILSLLDKLRILDYYNRPSNDNNNVNNNVNNIKTINLLNLNFNNRVGLAAGLDKNGECLSAFSKLGFGFIEVGTVTPRPQAGNIKPRLFRLIQDEAIINRMGFNNLGVDNLVDRLKNFRKNSSNIIIGANIGKNADTPIEPVELAIDDYLTCLEKVYLHCDYICLNISSPNTLNLRQLQSKDYLEKLLSAVKAKQLQLNQQYNQYRHIAIKISPDLISNELIDIADLIIKYKIDILIATNTTIDNKLLYDQQGNKISGGLSGRPLFDKSNQVLAQIHNYFVELNYRKNLIIIGVGGINSKSDAVYKLSLGADLVQVYTGLIYQGPNLIKQLQEL